MSAMYQVSLSDGRSVIVHSADASSMKRSALVKALRKARIKAEKRYRAKAVSVRCVG